MKTIFGASLGLIAVCYAETEISTFSDSGCQVSLNLFEGPNGYPDGICTSLRTKGNYSSFQLIAVDPGCTVSIYSEDATENVCSGAVAAAELMQCYNASSLYYSVDHCDAPEAQSTSTAESGTGSTRSSTTLGPSLATSMQPVSTSLPGSQRTSFKRNTGGIAGGVVGGVLGLALIAGVLLYLLRRSHRHFHEEPEEESKVHTSPSELATDNAPWYERDEKIHEMQGVEVGRFAELPGSIDGSSKHPRAS